MTNFGKVKIDGVLCSPFNGSNASAVTSTTPVAVKAAVAGKKHYITRAQVTQPTPAEAGFLVLEDDTGTPVVLARFGFNGVLGLDCAFNPPLEVAAGKAINLRSSGSVGDAFINVQGYVQD